MYAEAGVSKVELAARRMLWQYFEVNSSRSTKSMIKSMKLESGRVSFRAFIMVLKSTCALRRQVQARE